MNYSAGYPANSVSGATLVKNKDKMSIKQQQVDKEFSINNHIFNKEAKI